MAEFEEDMQGVRLENAKVYYLQRDNHLEDTLLYSKRFLRIEPHSLSRPGY